MQLSKLNGRPVRIFFQYVMEYLREMRALKLNGIVTDMCDDDLLFKLIKVVFIALRTSCLSLKAVALFVAKLYG